MSDATLTCTKCKQELFEQLAQADPPQHCPNCDHQMRLALFPAWFRSSGKPAELGHAIVSDEASCFFHEKKQATTSCDECGRFICSLCDLQLAGRHLCPKCLESGSRRGKLTDLERQRTRYDRIALTLGLLSLLFLFIAPITAAIGIGMILWKWNAPPSRVSNSRMIMSVMLVVLILELVGGFAVWYGVYRGV